MIGYIGPMTDAIINQITKEVKKKKTREKILSEIVDPLLYDITSRYYPHFITATIFLILIVLLLLTITFMIIFDKK